MWVKKNTLNVTEPEKKICYWRKKTHSAHWNQICAGVVCVVGFLLIFGFTLSLSIDTKSSTNKNSYSGLISNRNSKCKLEAQTNRSVLCRDIDTFDNISDIVENIFKGLDNSLGENHVSLTIENIFVKDGILSKGWIHSSIYYIKELKIDSENIKDIEDGAFDERIFEELQVLTLVKIRLKSLRPELFTGLIAMTRLEFTNCHIREIQTDALKPLQMKLEVLSVVQMQHLWDPKQLVGSVLMHNLVTVEFSYNGNGLAPFDENTFKGLYKCKQIFFRRCHISEIGERTFVPMRELTLISLESNQLSHLNENVFNPMTMENIYININPWKCDCDLEWLKDLQRKGIVKDNPECDILGTAFNETDFCENNSSPSTVTESTEITTTTTNDISTLSTSIKPTETTTTESTTTISTTANSTTTESTNTELSTTESTTPKTTTETNDNEKTMQLNCSTHASKIRVHTSRKLFSIDEYSSFVAKPTINFNISDIDLGKVRIDFKSDSERPFFLLWFSVNIHEPDISCTNLKYSIKRGIESGSIGIGSLAQGKSYTFCFVEDNEETIPPLNCKSHITDIPYSDKTWLSNRYKVFVLVMTTFVVILLCVVSALIMWAIVRKYPTLMRGSKRVVLVKRKNVDALVLPTKFTEIETKMPQTELPEHGFRRPRFRRSVSESSLVSGSYISAVEPTTTQLLNFRLDRLRNRLGNENTIRESTDTSEDLPAVPPRPIMTIEGWDCQSISEIISET